MRKFLILTFIANLLFMLNQSAKQGMNARIPAPLAQTKTATRRSPQSACTGSVGLLPCRGHSSSREITKGMETSAIAAATIYSFISPGHASVCRPGAPRKKITISPIISLCMSFSVTTCRFDASIPGDQPQDIRKQQHARQGYSSQFPKYVSAIETTLT